MPTARFVLVHAAWHGAWCWDRLATDRARSVLGVEPLELDAGHSRFFTHPRELAELIELLG